jgi:hypothetical protein
MKSRPRRHPVRARWLGFVVLAVLVAACGVIPPTEPGPTANTRFDIVSTRPVAAGEAVIYHASGVSLMSAVPLEAGLIVRASTSGDRTRIAWVSTETLSGPKVQITFASPEGALEPTLGAARAFENSGDADIGASVLSMRVATSTATAAPAPPPRVHAHPDDVVLEPWFADFLLGDLNADGLVDVRDAVMVLAAIDGASNDAYTLYHSDLDGNYATDLDDVRIVLDKIVDPTLPAALHVKPRRISFVQLDPTTDRSAMILVGNRGNLPLVGVTWVAPDVGVSSSSTLADGSRALRLSIATPTPKGWLPGPFVVAAEPDWRASVLVGNVVILVAGQSNASGRGRELSGWPESPNASVRMLGNDYVWRHAQEPLDSMDGQVDLVSAENSVSSPKYSYGTLLGTLLHEALGYHAYLIPAARGGTSTSQWKVGLPGSPQDPAYLFGSANFRAQVSAGNLVGPAASNPYPNEGGPLTAVTWYQGESDNSSASRRSVFISNTNTIMDTFRAETGAPIVYVQLASAHSEQLNVANHDIAERQRQMETGSGVGSGIERSDFFMVVAHDLPRSDGIHLSAYGQRVLAQRMSLAVREHVFGEAIDGTGPRITSLRYAGRTVTIGTTMPLLPEPLDPTWFTVFDGLPSGSLDDVANYGQNAIAIESVVRDPADPSSIQITLTSEPSGTPHVRHMSPPLRLPKDVGADPHVWEVVGPGVARGAVSLLPLPAFGPLPAAPF